jgi:hypothetical protein
VRFKNQLESLLEQAHIKLSSLVSDPDVLAAMADRNLRATPAQLRDALSACRN